MVACIFGIAVALRLGPSDHEIDGQRAVEIAVRFAHSVGYRGKIGTGTVSPVDGKRWGFGPGTYQSLSLTLPDKRWINVYLTPTGSVQMFQAMQPGAQSPRGAQETKKADVIARAKELIKIVGAPGQFRMRKMEVGQKDVYGGTYFDVTVNNLKFLNLNPTYGYRVDFNTVTGELTYYSRPPKVPEVDATQPAISSAKAMALLEHWGKTHYKTVGGTGYLYGPSWRYTPSLVPELGYYKFKNEDKARLVWLAHMWMQFDKRVPATEAGTLRMLCDAVTGELVWPDDPGMG